MILERTKTRESTIHKIEGRIESLKGKGKAGPNCILEIVKATEDWCLGQVDIPMDQLSDMFGLDTSHGSASQYEVICQMVATILAGDSENNLLHKENLPAPFAVTSEIRIGKKTIIPFSQRSGLTQAFMLDSYFLTSPKHYQMLIEAYAREDKYLPEINEADFSVQTVSKLNPVTNEYEYFARVNALLVTNGPKFADPASYVGKSIEFGRLALIEPILPENISPSSAVETAKKMFLLSSIQEIAKKMFPPSWRHTFVELKKVLKYADIWGFDIRKHAVFIEVQNVFVPTSATPAEMDLLDIGTYGFNARGRLTERINKQREPIASSALAKKYLLQSLLADKPAALLAETDPLLEKTPEDYLSIVRSGRPGVYVEYDHENDEYVFWCFAGHLESRVYDPGTPEVMRKELVLANLTYTQLTAIDWGLIGIDGFDDLNDRELRLAIMAKLEQGEDLDLLLKKFKVKLLCGFDYAFAGDIGRKEDTNANNSQ